MRLETQLAVQMPGGGVSVDNFEMEGVHTEFAGSIFEERHRLLAPAAAAVVFAEEEFVDEGIAAQPFEAVSKADHDVADGNACVEDEPGAAEVWIAEERN